MQVDDGDATAGASDLALDLGVQPVLGDVLLAVERVHQRVLEVPELDHLVHEVDDVALGEAERGLGRLHRLELRLEREDLVHGSRRRRRVSIGCVEPAGESTLGRATAARPAVDGIPRQTNSGASSGVERSKITAAIPIRAAALR